MKKADSFLKIVLTDGPPERVLRFSTVLGLYFSPLYNACRVFLTFPPEAGLCALAQWALQLATSVSASFPPHHYETGPTQNLAYL